MLKKGIFCLEGLWYDDLRKRSTVKPILELLVRLCVPKGGFGNEVLS